MMDDDITTILFYQKANINDNINDDINDNINDDINDNINDNINDDNVKKMKDLIETMRLQQKQDAEALIKAQLSMLELEQTKETIRLLESKLKISNDKLNEIERNAFDELLAIRLTKNDIIKKNEELELELSLAHKSRHILLVNSNESNSKIKELFDQLNDYSKRIEILEKDNFENDMKLKAISIEKKNLSEQLNFSLLENEALQNKIAEYDDLLVANKESDILCQSALLI